MEKIDPRKVTVRIYGHDVRITITETTHPQTQLWLNEHSDDEIFDIESIEDAINDNERHGEIKGAIPFIETENGQEKETTVCYAGTWQIVPEYELLFRIFRWQYCYNEYESLTKEDYKKTFGMVMGEHYYQKWIGFEGSIPQMVGYFGDDMLKGQLFLDMIMEKVVQYEKRIKQTENENRNN